MSNPLPSVAALSALGTVFIAKVAGASFALCVFVGAYLLVQMFGLVMGFL